MKRISKEKQVYIFNIFTFSYFHKANSCHSALPKQVIVSCFTLTLFWHLLSYMFVFMSQTYSQVWSESAKHGDPLYSNMIC